MTPDFVLSATRPLQNKKILLGITGSIAACKADRIIRQLQFAGADVQVMLTESGARFFPPATAGALSANKVLIDMWDDVDPGEMTHLEAIENTDAILVAPATANRLLQIKNPSADDLFSTVITAFRGPVVYAPAMNPRLWRNPAVQSIVAEFSGQIIRPETGFMACRDRGPGRLAEPEVIVEKFITRLWPDLLAGQRWFISGGATREPWDDIRYLTNRSSGKMGEALARQAARLGADVTLVTCAEQQFYPDSGYRRVEIETTLEMQDFLVSEFSNSSAYIGAAAVADYRPEVVGGKIRSGQENISIDLAENPDIISDLRKKFPDGVLIGFSADDSLGAEKAREKAKKKELDAVVFNSLRQHDGGMGSDFNRNVLLAGDDFSCSLGRRNKNDVALQLLLWLLELDITPGS